MIEITQSGVFGEECVRLRDHEAVVRKSIKLIKELSAYLDQAQTEQLDLLLKAQKFIKESKQKTYY